MCRRVHLRRSSLTENQAGLHSKLKTPHVSENLAIEYEGFVSLVLTKLYSFWVDVRSS